MFGLYCCIRVDIAKKKGGCKICSNANATLGNNKFTEMIIRKIISNHHATLLSFTIHIRHITNILLSLALTSCSGWKAQLSSLSNIHCAPGMKWPMKIK